MFAIVIEDNRARARVCESEDRGARYRKETRGEREVLRNDEDFDGGGGGDDGNDSGGDDDEAPPATHLNR